MLDLRTLAFDLEKGQKELSEIIGVAQSQVSAMMNGKRAIRLEHIARLYEAFGKDVVDSYIKPDSAAAPFAATATFLPTAAVNEAREEGQASMLDELRRRADQMDELLAQQRTLIEQQGSLITQLDDAGKRVDKLIALLDK